MEIDLSQLKYLAGSTIYHRGMLYFKRGRVSLQEWDGTKVKSKVYGSKVYYVTIEFTKNGFYESCTCPFQDSYGGICKHIVATLLEYNKDDKGSTWE